MADLEGTTPANTFNDLLQVANLNTGLDATLRAISSGAGTDSILKLSTALMQLGASVAVGSILDEDDMTSNSATALATQQSVKAYVDASGGGGGSKVLLLSQSASTSANIVFNSTYLTSTYKNFVLEMINVIPATDEVSFYFTASTDNGSSYLAGTNYEYHIDKSTVAGSSYASTASNAAAQIPMIVAAVMGNNTGESYSGSIVMSNPLGTASYKLCDLSGSVFNSVGETITSAGIGTIKTVSAINNIKLATSSGNITSGTFNLYGIADS